MNLGEIWDTHELEGLGPALFFFKLNLWVSQIYVPNLWMS